MQWILKFSGLLGKLPTFLTECLGAFFYNTLEALSEYRSWSTSIIAMGEIHNIM